MSHRTADLPPLTGIAHVIRELRYYEGARQALAVVLVLLYTVTAAPIPVLAAIGLPIALVGAFVRLYASGFIVKNQELATDGAYRFVRHPLYTGNILLVVGFALAGSRWWGTAARAVLLLVLLPDGDRVRRPQAAPHLRRGVGEVVRAHAGADAALRRRAAGGTGDRRWSLAVSNSARRARVRRVRVGLRRVGRVGSVRSEPRERRVADGPRTSAAIDGRARRRHRRRRPAGELGSGYQASVHVYRTSAGDVVVKTAASRRAARRLVALAAAPRASRLRAARRHRRHSALVRARRRRVPGARVRRGTVAARPRGAARRPRGVLRASC